MSVFFFRAYNSLQGSLNFSRTCSEQIVSSDRERHVHRFSFFILARMRTSCCLHFKLVMYNKTVSPVVFATKHASLPTSMTLFPVDPSWSPWAHQAGQCSLAAVLMVQIQPTFQDLLLPVVVFLSASDDV